MAKTRPPYTPEFRRQMVELVHADMHVEELLKAVSDPPARRVRVLSDRSKRSRYAALLP
jgi:hypothetical protein